MTKNLRRMILFALICACNGPSDSIPVQYAPRNADYSAIDLIPTGDTLKFPLSDSSFNTVRSISFFQRGKDTAVAIFDKKSKSISVYDHVTGKQLSRYTLEGDSLPSSISSAYILNKDSIFIVNRSELILADSAGHVLNKIPFTKDPKYTFALISMTQPVVVKGHHAYLVIDPVVDPSRKKNLKSWKVMYDFDLISNTATPVYHFPEGYYNNFYGRFYFEHNFCLNEKGNFVLSFTADTSLYETDFQHINFAYSAKSNLQSKPLSSLAGDSSKDDNATRKFYMTNYAYGPVYYDAYHQRYIRHTKLPIDEKDYTPKSKKRNQQLLILNKNFSIIGQSEFGPEIIVKQLLISPRGDVYARVKPEDEYHVNFIRLEYKENKPASHISKLK